MQRIMKEMEQRTVSIESQKGAVKIFKGTEEEICQTVQTYAAELGGDQSILVFELGGCIQDNKLRSCQFFEKGEEKFSPPVSWVIAHQDEFSNTRLKAFLAATHQLS